MNNKKKPRIALVADQFTTFSLAPDADLVQITPLDWRWKLRLFKPDFLFIESTWRGYKNSWQGKIASYAHSSPNKPELSKLLDYCRKQKITTIFWNKEDPFHFERFADAAALFDVVYTTDIGSLARYRALPHQAFQHVGVLMFAAQPRWYQPAEAGERGPGIAFLGGYYGNELADRSRAQEDVLYALRDRGLIIFDRFWQHNSGCSYPEKLQPYCKPAISPALVAKAYRQYQIYLNFNTISQSTTMLSRRVFELAAAGCPIISTPSLAMANIFDESVISISNGTEAREWCVQLQKDAQQRSALGEQAKEIVLAQHTWQHRLNQLNSELSLY
ncbi:CgeB family protein [Aeromonas hydrophila]|uniref:CgeB family protein n=1 Tax=Aeromonas hydrophila TaxID=644 RepID=UPI001F5CF538|nr:glycosyltransferase [Aeromonas hydrophila]UMQ39323.1 glycosyltransferase [Aeromonas hydrophila]UMQ47858.1 glycosyltransferase [Aeromonas hydrophila]